MAHWMIAGVGCVYLYVAFDLMAQGKTGLAITFVGYALGNLGLYMVSK